VSELLGKIEGPADLKSLTYSELSQLAEEIRNELVTTVTKTGGHLASSLGVVELSIALHRVFDSPTDKLVWDVGHQSYAHKLLTGRRERFCTLRQYRGISGFPDCVESPHDAFGTGHASTSVSAALGMPLARDLSGQSYHVIAITGDGALTGGMAIEALNHAGHQGTKLIIVLNDNGMAISPSVGALSRLLRRVSLDARYEKAKKGARRTVTFLPSGELAWALSKRIKGGIKRALVPGALWEKFGYTYVGPVDGHDFHELEAALIRARDYEAKPTIVHVLTRKGKGYSYAEADATRFHGIPPGDIETGINKSYSEISGQTVLKLMQENTRVVAITAAMLDGTGLALASRVFPHRVFDVGICEQHAVTFAAGLASQGFIPIVAIYSTFLQRAFDQVVHDVCIQNLPVVFAVDRAGIVGEDGKTHQGILDLSYLSCIPNLVVAAPRDENELRHLLYTAVKAGCPMAIRYPRGSVLGVSLEDEFRELPLGKGEALKDGSDIAIVAIGSTVAPSVEAARILGEKGIDCAVLDARYTKPLDSELILESASKTKKVVTVEENVLAGGFGSAVMDMVSSINGVRVLRMGLPDEFIEQGPQELLRANYKLDAKGIAVRIESFLSEIAGGSPSAQPQR